MAARVGISNIIRPIVNGDSTNSYGVSCFIIYCLVSCNVRVSVNLISTLIMRMVTYTHDDNK